MIYSYVGCEKKLDYISDEDAILLDKDIKEFKGIFEKIDTDKEYN